ncbi:MAG: hypothetical protein ACRCWS_08635 [Propionibacteriaceae bacterium]
MFGLGKKRNSHPVIAPVSAEVKTIPGGLIVTLLNPRDWSGITAATVATYLEEGQLETFPLLPPELAQSAGSELLVGPLGVAAAVQQVWAPALAVQRDGHTIDVETEVLYPTNGDGIVPCRITWEFSGVGRHLLVLW